jgi:hypothetical protein
MRPSSLAVAAFRGDALQPDDMTCVVVRVENQQVCPRGVHKVSIGLYKWAKLLTSALHSVQLVTDCGLNAYLVSAVLTAGCKIACTGSIIRRSCG